MKTEETQEDTETLLTLAREVEDNAKNLLIHAMEFRNDWREGDFQLSDLAKCDMESMEAQFGPLWDSLKRIATHRLKNPTKK